MNRVKSTRGNLRKWVLAICGLTLPAMLFAQPVKESLLKAAFTYNFMIFTEWPEQMMANSKEITLCVNPASEMSKSLFALSGKFVNYRQLRVKALKGNDQDLQQCHALYLDHLDGHRWSEIKKKITGTSTLTISDDAQIGREGIMILLERSGDQMVFDVDLKSAQETGLLISSKLLRLARRVY